MIDLQAPATPSTPRYRPTPPRRCDDCRAWSCSLTTVTYQVARQTHWSPAEYDEAHLCPACIDKARRDAEEEPHDRD